MTTTPTSTPSFLTLEQTAALLGLHVATVRRHVQAGKLPAVWLGYKTKRIPIDVLAHHTGSSVSTLRESLAAMLEQKGEPAAAA